VAILKKIIIRDARFGGGGDVVIITVIIIIIVVVRDESILFRRYTPVTNVIAFVVAAGNDRRAHSRRSLQLQ